ncbi:hypothetical protein HPP92_004265 [Vanilla planifolia]|uniref:Uncharacterized protein n=1 Tax=Vanilla planifolia TaxID=51239 RepID=A0A835RM11_VANPL|nr:hypothetical protein HPP92_004709 [Vanilla planifolia]KAG0493271.1 hypothetical protein HPP92_004265 [Vanilla planifolia]
MAMGTGCWRQALQGKYEPVTSQFARKEDQHNRIYDRYHRDPTEVTEGRAARQCRRADESGTHSAGAHGHGFR